MHLGIFSNRSSNKEQFLNTQAVLGGTDASRCTTAHRILISYYTQTTIPEYSLADIPIENAKQTTEQITKDNFSMLYQHVVRFWIQF